MILLVLDKSYIGRTPEMYDRLLAVVIALHIRC